MSQIVYVGTFGAFGPSERIGETEKGGADGCIREAIPRLTDEKEGCARKADIAAGGIVVQMQFGGPVDGDQTRSATFAFAHGNHTLLQINIINE